MKRLVCLSALIVAGNFAFAAQQGGQGQGQQQQEQQQQQQKVELQKGICTGETLSGKTVEMVFCAPAAGGTEIASCTGDGRRNPEVQFTRILPDDTKDTKVLEVKYSQISENKEDAFEAKAYSVSDKDLQEGVDHEWMTVNAVADGPSAFALDLGKGWRFSFENAECHFEALADQGQQQEQQEGDQQGQDQGGDQGN